MEYFFGTRSGGWQDQDRERAAQLEEERKKSKKEKAKALQEVAKNPQEPQNLPLPVQNPQVDILTPPREESSETSGDPEASQSPQPSGSGSGGSGGDQDGSDDGDNPENVPNMAPPRIFEDENGVDDEDWYKKKVEVKWDQKDLLFFFSQLEDAMSFAGIKKQYTKRRILVTNLPKKQVV